MIGKDGDIVDVAILWVGTLVVALDKTDFSMPLLVDWGLTHGISEILYFR